MYFTFINQIILLSMTEVQLQMPSLAHKPAHEQQIAQLHTQASKQKHSQQHAQIVNNQFLPQQVKPIQEKPPYFQNYFQEKLVQHHHQTMVIGLTQEKLSEMNKYIRMGMIRIPQNSKFIGDIISKSPKQDQKLQEYLQHKGMLQNQLRKMEDAIRNSQHELASSRLVNREADSASFISPEQHRRIVEKITKIKKQLNERKRLHQEYEQNRIKQLQKKEEESLKRQQQQELQQKHKQLKQRIQKIMQRRQKMKQQQVQSLKRFKSVREQKRRHQIMQQEYHSSIVLPIIQEHSLILSERSKKQNSIKIQDIKEYEKEYIKKRQERQKESRSKQGNEWHYKAPPYNSSMMKLMEMEKRQEKIREEEEKKRIQALRKRQQTYKEYLNQRFSSVKIDQKKRQQIEIRLKNEKISKGLSEEETRQLGNKYLVQIKLKPKSINKEKKSLSTIQGKSPKIRENFKIKSSTAMSNYESEPSSSFSDRTINKIDKIISSTSNKHEKVQKLKIQVDKLSEKTSRKQQLRKYVKKNKQQDRQDIENLLSSIQAKVNIIQLYKQ